MCFILVAKLSLAEARAYVEAVAASHYSGRGVSACKIGDPSRIRTCNPRSRNPLLYPVELWDRPGGNRPGYSPYRLSLSSTANMKNPLSRQDGRTDFFDFATKADGGSWPMARPDIKPAAGTPPGGAAGTVWTASAMHATFSQARIPAISPSPFRALFDVTRLMSAARSPS